MITLSPFLALVLAVLIVASMAASAAETALFSLTGSELRKAGERVRALVADARALLVTVLCANLAVNILIFAFATQIEVPPGPLAAAVRDLAVLFVVVCVGEVVPKTLALRARLPIARIAAIPLTFLVRVFRPAQRTFDRTIEAFDRALGLAAPEEAGITAERLELVLEKSAEHGHLLDSEAEILSGIVELESVRVREIMTPRVDMLVLDKNERDHSEAIGKALAAKAPWLIVVDGTPDKVVGRVRLRDLLKDPQRPILEFLTPVRFVPEVATALDALHFLREVHLAQAVVVDEWGGTAGLLTIEDIFEQVLGDLRVEGERVERPVVQLGEGRFRVDGGLSIREWNEHFGRRVVATEFETVAGLVTALLGHIPRAGDEVRVGGLVLRVHSTNGRRIREVDIRLEEPREPRAGGHAA